MSVDAATLGRQWPLAIAAVAATTALMTAVVAGVPAINDSCGDYSSCSGDLGRPVASCYSSCCRCWYSCDLCDYKATQKTNQKYIKTLCMQMNGTIVISVISSQNGQELSKGI